MFKMSGHSFNCIAWLKRTSSMKKSDKNLFKTIYVLVLKPLII